MTLREWLAVERKPSIKTNMLWGTAANTTLSCMVDCCLLNAYIAIDFFLHNMQVRASVRENAREWCDCDRYKRSRFLNF